MPSTKSELRPARKSGDRPLGFRSGDWLVSPLTSGGYFAWYVVSTACPSILLMQVRQRFETAPVLEQLDSIDDSELVGVVRLKLGPYRLNRIQCVESRRPRDLYGQRPVV